ncbi:MAG: hypothetical protein IKD13_08645, partial [Firmicutes bacterium]|nr:hypothetical protein [Bacillota bacterium]
MQLEFWAPDREQLKKMTDELMNRRMGEDWRTYFDPQEDQYCLKAVIGWPEGKFLMTAGEWPMTSGSGSWSGTTTEALYRDAWGTALMDAGRIAIKSYIANKRYCGNPNGFEVYLERMRLAGPGLGVIPLEEMKTLYDQLKGWEIGIELNEACVLIPDKSFGGWFEEEEITPGVDHTCRPGVGCQFCALRGTKQCKQHRRGLRLEDRTKGEIQ